MFTSSLATALLWSTDRSQLSQLGKTSHAKELHEFLAGSDLATDEIPVVARSENLIAVREVLGDIQMIDSPGDRWWYGRFGADSLTKYMKQGAHLPFHREVVDLGTPVEHLSGVATGVPDCELILKANPLAASGHDLVVVLVDRGDPSATPETFQGRLEYLQGPVSLTLSQHARQVLSILVDRLASHRILDRTRLVASLVEDPQAQVGNNAFQHANTVEMTAAIDRVYTHFINEQTPVLVNLSMGTHVGPHCGNSPIETLVKRVFHPADDRFLFAAAGNDGMRGIHARRSIQPRIDEYFPIKVSAGGIEQLLVEFWYLDVGTPPTFSVELYPPTRAYALMNRTPLLSGAATSTSMKVLVNALGVAVSSLCWTDRYPQGLRCTTLGLKTDPPPAGDRLADYTLQVSVQGGPTNVNAWIVVSAPQHSAHFLAGNLDGSVRVPATAETSVSVGAVLGNRQPWAGSAVGPAFDYGPSSYLGSPLAPLVSHLGDLQGQCFTSFATPRVTADAAALVQRNRRRFADVRALVDDLGPQPPTAWHPRLGYVCLA